MREKEETRPLLWHILLFSTHTFATHTSTRRLDRIMTWVPNHFLIMEYGSRLTREQRRVWKTCGGTSDDEGLHIGIDLCVLYLGVVVGDGEDGLASPM